MKKSRGVSDDFGEEGFGPGSDLVFSILAVLIVILVVQQIAAAQVARELAVLKNIPDTDLSYIRQAKTQFLDSLLAHCAMPSQRFVPEKTVTIKSGSCDMLVKDSPQFQTVVFNESVLFDTKQYALKPGGREVLMLVRRVMSQRQNDIVEVQILGHTDNQGGEEFNLELGYQRAREVFKLLTTLASPEHIDPLGPMISVTTYGYYRPVIRSRDADFSATALEAANADDAQRAINRRIELNIFYHQHVKAAKATP